MKFVGIRRKSDGEILMSIPMGQSYRLPKGLTMADVDIVSIFVPEVVESKKWTLEEIKAAKERQEKIEKELRPFIELASENNMGLGDLVAAITTSTGFKEWWGNNHDGECTKCNERQAAWNYYKFKTPSWMSSWIKNILKGKKTDA